MAPRTTPTERQRRLGSELRRLRMAAGMSAERAAGLLGVDRGRLSNMESGQRGISEERLRTLVCNCDCTDERYVEALVQMATAGPGWWEPFRGSLPQGMLDIAELEANSPRMRVWNMVHIPGLLQTSDHALAVFRLAIPSLPEHEVALRLAHRTQRQQILLGEAPPQYLALIHEAALRMRFGTPDVVRGQLAHLIDMSERDNITVLVIPFESGGFPSAGQAVLYVEGRVPQLDTVQVDSSHGPDFLHAESQLAKYRAQLDWLQELALTPGPSRAFIREIANQL
ncbi:helix-turn-helix domain-containing protein [Streptomyces millisiae]|uniref:Helix-turn-helix transcriptional regulator n=1 Tax=Streptomyces millisiae TaxID=3075542 RepID=A0ABU2LLT5_9ACTN|nr:helix-turn-helix transcriptional regulator [Streptomyces sp. DSM 44918]MDT0318470.1 helix-turn-helix transcriptional regulator [Streptomyces sp. DSM 44918]